jgi:hypothetical protein
VGPLEPRSAVARAAGAAAFLCAVALFVLFQEIGLRLRREEQRAWWPGTGRDALNAAGFGGIAAALVAFGFPAPAAVVAGGTLTLVLFGTSLWLETRPWRLRRALAFLAGALVALPLVVFPGAILDALAAISGRLFPAR